MAYDADRVSIAWGKWKEEMGICQHWSGNGVWHAKKMVESKNNCIISGYNIESSVLGKKEKAETD